MSKSLAKVISETIKKIAKVNFITTEKLKNGQKL